MARQRTRTFGLYFYRGETIEAFASGWTWMEETCRGEIESPVYRTIEDAKNAIRKALDGTHTAEPRTIGKAVWSDKDRTWNFEKEE